MRAAGLLKRRPPALPVPRPSPADAAPRRVVDWLPLLWTRVLFPGSASAAGSWQWRPFLLVLLASAALLYPCLSFPLFEPDEGRYAQIPREMLDRGDWILPTLQGQPYLDKPPLFYWLVMLAYATFGYHDWAARLVPALAMQGSVFATFLIGRRLLGDRAAYWGALLLTVSPGFLGMGRLLLLDGLLTCCVTVAVLVAFLAQRGQTLHRGWWLTAALACGLGILAKGPVALVLTLVPFWSHRWLVRERAPISRGAWLGFVAIALAVALPWYVAICCRRPEFGTYFLWQHNVQRFVDPFDHDRPVWFYVPIILAGLLPLTLLLRGMFGFLNAGRGAAPRRRPPEMGYLLLAGGWCVLFFSLSGCKLPTYVLPAFAPLCLAAGCFVAAMRLHRSRWLIGIATGCWLLLAVGHYALVPWYAWQRSPLTGPGELLEVCRDPATPVVCFPRNVDSLAFYLGRSDFRSFRSKQIGKLMEFVGEHDRTVIVFGHRHSLAAVQERLPPGLRITATAPMGPCDMAVIEREGAGGTGQHTPPPAAGP